MNIQKIKEPGSAITHFIGMLMAIFAAIPLLIKAAHEPGHVYIVSLAIYAVSLILLYAASTTYHTFNISEKVNTILKKIDHMMIFVLIAGSYTPVCLLVLRGRTGLLLLITVWPIALIGIFIKVVLGILSKMGFLDTLYRHGLDMCTRFFQNLRCSFSDNFWMASCRRNHLHNWRHYLCIKASAF